MADKEQDKIKKKLSGGQIVCLVCAVVLMAVTFTPFIFEMDMRPVGGAELDFESYICAYMSLYKAWLGDARIILGYLPVVLGILVIVATIRKNNILRIIMLVMDVVVAGFWVYAGNRVVAKIFVGDLYEPGPGYYMLLVAAIVVLIATLVMMTKEKNKVENA